MKMRIVTIFIFCFCGLGAQQLPFISSFSETGFIWNPALTGNRNQVEVGAAYQRDWAGYETAPQLANAFVQIPVFRHRMALGAHLMHDRVGLLENVTAQLTYAYHMGIGLFRDDHLSIGISVNMTDYRFDIAGAIARESFDPLILSHGVSDLIFNAGAGLLYKSAAEDQDHFFFGTAILQPIPQTLHLPEEATTSYFQQTLHANAIFGGIFYTENFFLEPIVRITYTSPGLFHGQLQLKIQMSEVFWAAVGYGSDHTLVPQIGFIIQGDWLSDAQLRVGVQGTSGLGQLGQFQGNGYGFLMAYTFH